MSTRCQVQVVQEKLDWDSSVTLYHHCDGYPTGMLPLFAEAFTKFGHNWQAGRAGKAAAMLCAVDPTGFECEAGHTLHCDVDFYYRVFVVNTDKGIRWDVEVWIPAAKGTQRKPGRLTQARIEVGLAADTAAAIEAEV